MLQPLFSNRFKFSGNYRTEEMPGETYYVYRNNNLVAMVSQGFATPMHELSEDDRNAINEVSFDYFRKVIY
ncbi:MAG: hypothetical protein IIY84_03930 [Eubacterium sp.]|nr:hypothetical protein [Eubacterium sp.]